MRHAALVALAAGLLSACASGDGPPLRAPPPPAPAPNAVESERAVNEKAYGEQVLGMAGSLKAEHLGEWIAIAGGSLWPANEGRTLVAPAATMEEADAAARREVPGALHRFVFRVGEDGDEDHDLGGSEVPHTLGVAFLGAWEGRAALGPNVALILDGKKVSTRAEDGRPFVRAALLPPAGDGGVEADWVLSTGFSGFAVLPAETAERAGLALWEIPGTAHIDGILQKGDCRRARARIRIPAAGGLVIDMPVAVWPAR